MNPAHLTPEAAVAASGLSLSYGGNPVLRDIDLALPRGQVLALLGPSGCGKTTLLRLVAGLLAPTAGRIEIAGRVVADAAGGGFVPPEARGLGMVFQDYALWPHMSVAGNVAFPLEMRGVARSRRPAMVAAALERVGLGALADRRPSDMSGGQQQRVAIARAIVSEPALVLFDEPLSNLDRELRETMVSEIGSLVAALGFTAIYVTHDQSEAFALADQVAVMRGGRIEQMAPPEVLVDRPASPAVAEFLRLGCVLPVLPRDAGWALAEGAAPIALPPGIAAPTHALVPARSVRLGPPEGAILHGRVLRTQFRGDAHLATVAIDGTDRELQVASPHRLPAGEPLGLAVDPDDLRWFASPTS